MRKSTSTKILFFVLIALIILSYLILYYGSQKTITITVDSKERVTKGNDSKYLIYDDTTAFEVFENTDAPFLLKWNSSDVYRKLHEGHTYKVRVAGWRIPIFSQYRNILNIVSEVEQ
jgi:hypothetical protein